MFSTHSLISLDRALGKDARKATPQQQDHGSRLRRAVGRCCDRQVVCLHCGDAVGHGDAVGATQMVGDSVGTFVGALVGTGVGASVGVSVGASVAAVRSTSPNSNNGRICRCDAVRAAPRSAVHSR